MISFRASALPVLGFLIVLAGCGGATSTANGPDSTESTTKATSVAQASPAPAQRFHGGGGQEFLLRAALREPLNLTDAQKTTIENAMTASEPKGPPPDMHAHMATLAASVRAGKVDTTQTFQPSDAEVNARIAASAKALDTLHATLTPAQRQALVDAVSTRGRDRHGPAMGERGDRGGDHMKEGRGPMGGLLIGLDVTDAQQAEIDAKLDAQKPSDADRAQMKVQHEAFEAQMKARLATFASDNFDATAFVTPPAGAMQQGHKDRMAEDLAIVVSVLDPAQRDKLATRLEQGPTMQAPANAQPVAK